MPEGEEERRNNICKDLETDDIRSEHTQYDPLTMNSFLNDVMAQTTHSYMAAIAEEMEVDDAGDKIPQSVRPVTPPRVEPVLTRHAPLCTDETSAKVVSCQQEPQALPTETSTESQYIQPHLMEMLGSVRPSQENLIELNDLTLCRDDSSVQSSSLIHMSEYASRTNAMLCSSPSSTPTNTLTAAQGQPSRQPSLTVTNCNLLGRQKMGDTLPYIQTQMASSMPRPGLPALQSCRRSESHSHDVAFSQRLRTTRETHVPLSHVSHATTQERHFMSSCDRSISHDGYVEENLQRMHQRVQARKPVNYRMGSPVGSVECLQQKVSLASAAEGSGLGWNPQDVSSPLPPKNPFQSGTMVSNVLQSNHARPSSRLSTDSGMTLLSSSSSEQSVFTDAFEQPLPARNVWSSRRHSSGVSSMPLSIPTTPDTGQQSFQFPEAEVQLSHEQSVIAPFVHY